MLGRHPKRKERGKRSDPPASDLLALHALNFLMRAASTFEIRNGEQRAIRKYSASWSLPSFKRCYAPSDLADTLKRGQEQAQD